MVLQGRRTAPVRRRFFGIGPRFFQCRLAGPRSASSSQAVMNCRSFRWQQPRREDAAAGRSPGAARSRPAKPTAGAVPAPLSRRLMSAPLDGQE